MTRRYFSLPLALTVLVTVLVAFFSPFLFVYAQSETPTDPAPTEPTPTEPTPTEPQNPTSPEEQEPTPTQATGGNGFVPLTSLPGISEVTSSNNIASFLNQLYRLSIGAAAVLAVLQIIRAGLMYMTEESISEKKEARHIITMAILGLILVLSPAIVFGVIDPRILDLSIDLQGIQPSTRTGEGQTGGDQNGTGGDTGTDNGDAGGDEGQGDEEGCPPGQIEEFSSDGSFECVAAPEDEQGTGNNTTPVQVNLTAEQGESQGIVYIGYIFGVPSSYSCTDLPNGGTTCGYGNAVGEACSYFVASYYRGTSQEAVSSCQTDPQNVSGGGEVFVNCEARSVPQTLTFNVRTPRCGGQPAVYNP